MKKLRILSAIVTFSLTLAIFAAMPMTASADFCTDLSDEFAGFLDCTDQFSSFTDFEGGLEAPDTAGYDPSLTQATDARTYIKNIANFALGFLGFIAVLVIIYSGFLYVTSRGEDEPMEKGKKGIMYAVMGILIILASFAIVNTVLQAPGGDANNISQDGRVYGSAGGRSSTNTNQLANFNSAAEEVKDVTREYLKTYETFQQRNVQLQTLLTYEPNTFTRRSDFVDYLDYLKSELRKIQRTSGNLSYTSVTIEAVIAQVLNPGIQEISEVNRAEEEDFIQDTAFENDIKNFFDNIGRNASEWANSLFGKSSTLKKNFECSLPPEDRSVDYSLENCSEADQTKNTTNLGSNIDAQFDKMIRELVLTEGLYKDYDEELAQYELRLTNIRDSLSRTTSSSESLTSNLDAKFDAVIEEGLQSSVKADQIALFFAGRDENPFADSSTPDSFTENIENVKAVKDFIVNMQNLYTELKKLQFTAPVIVANVVKGSAPLVVTFDGTASYDPSGQSIKDGQYEWDTDGDGQPGESSDFVECSGDYNKASITCTYSTPGAYIVALKVESTDADKIQTGITYLPIRVTPPTARIELKVTPGLEGDPLLLRQYDSDGNLAIDLTSFSVTLSEASSKGILFDASGTEGDGEGTKSDIAKYEWFFGDSTSQVTGSGENVTGGTTGTGSENTKTITRKFSKRGRYNAYLMVTDKQGNTDRKVFDIIVTSTVARVSADKTTGVPGDTITFDGSGSKTDSGSITNYKWTVNGDTNIEGNDKETFKYKFEDPGTYTVALDVQDGAGNTNQMLTEVTIESRAPRALFNVTFPEANKPSLVLLDASESSDQDPKDNETLKYTWRIFNAAQGTDYTIVSGALEGDKESASQVAILFNKKSTYKVELAVEDDHEASLKKTTKIARDVIIRNLIDVSFSEDQNYASQLIIAADGSLKSEAVFNIESKNGEIAEIDFGDGAKDTQRLTNGKVQFKHTYKSSKAYNVNVKVTKGPDNNTAKTVYIVGGGDEPIAIPTVKIGSSTYSNLAEIPEIYKGTTVTFDASASINADGTSNGLNYSWSFGDTKTSTSKVATNTYNDVAPRDPGYFLVKLTVRDASDGTKTSESEFHLKVVPAVPKAQAVIVNSLGGPTTPFNVQVEVIGANDRDGRIVQYRYYYFPLNDDQLELGVKTTNVPSSVLTLGVFGQSGDEVEYGICVDLKDDEGNEVKCKELFPSGTPATVKTKNGQNLPPSSKFRVDKTSINVGETIIFQDESKDQDGKIVEWVYDFDGDGSFTNDKVYEQPQVSHTYEERSPKEGYSVRLRVRDDKGAYSTSTPIKVFVEGRLDEPTVAFTYLATDLNVSFKNNSKADEDNGGAIVKAEWDFDTNLDSDGDGKSDNDVDSTAINTSHKYLRSGSYNVKLTVEDSEGNEAIISKQVIVQAIPAGAANPYATNTVNAEQNLPTGQLSNLLRTIPAVDADTDAIVLQGTAADIVFNFDHLPANIVRIMIDKNIYFDTNSGRPGTPGDGVRNNDVDFTSTAKNPYRTNFDKSWGPTRVQLAVIDNAGNVYTDQADVIFASSGLQAKLVFDPTDNIPAFIYIVLLFVIIVYGNYAIKKQAKKNKKIL